MLRIGVVGYGYWGPNIVRNLMNTDGVTVALVCDINPKSLVRLRHMYPSQEVTTNPDHVLSSPEIDAVAVVTPPSLHFPMARTACRT